MARAYAGRVDGLEHSVTGEKLSLLAVFARPEDEPFGPSGTLAKYAGEGVRVSLVTAARELAVMVPPRSPDVTLIGAPGAFMRREMLCSCRAAGISRLCLDHAPARSALSGTELMLERLVRLIREVEPQVIVTYGPQGISGDSEQQLVNRLTSSAFEMAGDAGAFPQHFSDGLSVYEPQKLYYSVLPESIISQWGLSGFTGVPDQDVTTILDVSPYSEMKLKAVYCQRTHSLDYNGWLESNGGIQWNEEHFILAASHLAKRSRKERDLFAGLR